MRSLLFVLSLFAGPATAADIIQLALAPTPPGITNLHGEYCTGNSFIGDTIDGVCQYVYGPSKADGVAPTVRYHVTWDLYGFVTLGAKCAADEKCELHFGESGTVEFGGTRYNYVTTSADGAHEVVSATPRSYLLTP